MFYPIEIYIYFYPLCSVKCLTYISLINTYGLGRKWLTSSLISLSNAFSKLAYDHSSFTDTGKKKIALENNRSDISLLNKTYPSWQFILYKWILSVMIRRFFSGHRTKAPRKRQCCAFQSVGLFIQMVLGSNPGMASSSKGSWSKVQNLAKIQIPLR